MNFLWTVCSVSCVSHFDSARRALNASRTSTHHISTSYRTLATSSTKIFPGTKYRAAEIRLFPPTRLNAGRARELSNNVEISTVYIYKPCFASTYKPSVGRLYLLEGSHGKTIVAEYLPTSSNERLTSKTFLSRGYEVPRR